uniref:HMMR_C domain-containing protein n=1 Tax=Syphacia muris TaxID=451379 RepID=A0A0N5A969_9BILA
MCRFSKAVYECQNWKRRCEALQVELTKRRHGDSQKHPCSERNSLLECEQKLLVQSKLLKQLGIDMKCALKEKAEASKRCADLEKIVLQKNSENDGLSALVNELRSKVAATEASQSAAIREHNKEIKVYQEILKKMETERNLMVEQLCTESPSAFIDISNCKENIEVLDGENMPYQLIGKDFDGVKKAFIKLAKEKKKLEKQVEALSEELKTTKATVEKLNDDLVARTEVNNRTLEELTTAKTNIAILKEKVSNSEKDVHRLQNDVSTFEKNCTQLTEELNKEKMSSDSLKTAISNYEDLLTSKTVELTELSYKLQCANDSIYKLRTKNFDLEANLTLNSRELKGARAKLERLKSKVKLLERESRDIPVRTESLPSPSMKAASISPVFTSTPTNTD